MTGEEQGMADEPAETDPQLSLATFDQLFVELERRFPDHVFAGRGGTLHDGEEGFVLKMLGNTDTRAGLVRRLAMVASMRMRDELRDAKWLDEDAEDED